MTGLTRALLGVHLVCAASATVCFWCAAFQAKGGPAHRRSGVWFARAVYLTASTGAILAITRLGASRPFDPALVAVATAERETMWLVLYVLLTIVAPVQHGLAVVAAGASPVGVRSVVHLSLNVLAMVGSLALFPAALLWGQYLFLIVAPIGLVVGLRNLNYGIKATATRVEWEREHLTSQITAGITLHTALFVFGTSRTLALNLKGIAAIWPWIVPALVGLPVVLWLRARR